MLGKLDRVVTWRLLLRLNGVNFASTFIFSFKFFSLDVKYLVIYIQQLHAAIWQTFTTANRFCSKCLFSVDNGLLEE